MSVRNNNTQDDDDKPEAKAALLCNILTLLCKEFGNSRGFYFGSF